MGYPGIILREAQACHFHMGDIHSKCRVSPPSSVRDPMDSNVRDIGFEIDMLHCSQAVFLVTNSATYNNLHINSPE